MSPQDEKFLRIQTEQQEEMRRRVERAQDFNELFEIVKRIVEQELGAHRAGLSLVLTSMPNSVGALHPVGSNIIVVNRSLIDGMRKVARDPREINSFVFMVLMHEYLHSLGYLSENDVRRLSQKICRNALGEGHLTVKLANANWLEMYPELAEVGQNFSKSFEVVHKFDTSSMSYIG